jgi:hypothetical protein
MKRPGFSVSTFLLVVLLLGAVAYVGSLVNPIKHTEGDGHNHEQEQVKKDGELPKPNEGVARNDSEERKKIQEQELQMRRKMMANLANNLSSDDKKKVKTKLPMKDPEAIDPTSEHFFQQDMGAQGITRQQAEVARLKKIYEAENKNTRRSIPPGGKPIAVEGTPQAAKTPAEDAKADKGHEGHSDHDGHSH